MAKESVRAGGLVLNPIEPTWWHDLGHEDLKNIWRYTSYPFDYNDDWGTRNRKAKGAHALWSAIKDDGFLNEDECEVRDAVLIACKYEM